MNIWNNDPLRVKNLCPVNENLHPWWKFATYIRRSWHTGPNVHISGHKNPSCALYNQFLVTFQAKFGVKKVGIKHHFVIYCPKSKRQSPLFYSFLETQIFGQFNIDIFAHLGTNILHWVRLKVQILSKIHYFLEHKE